MSDSPPLFGTATVMWKRGHILNHLDIETCRLDSTDSGFTPGTRPPNTKIDLFHAHLLDGCRADLSSSLSGKGRALTAALVTHGTTRLPCKGLSILIGNRHEGIIKGRLDMDDPLDDVLPDFLLSHFSPLIRQFRILVPAAE